MVLIDFLLMTTTGISAAQVLFFLMLAVIVVVTVMVMMLVMMLVMTVAKTKKIQKWNPLLLQIPGQTRDIIEQNFEEHTLLSQQDSSK